MKQKIICLIPVKHNSKRLKFKNFLKIQKKSLLERSINTARKSKLFSEIFISTDSKYAKKIATHKKLSIPFFRPKKLSMDPATITDVMLHTINYFKSKNENFDVMFVLSVTNPFYSPKDLKSAYQKFKKKNIGLLSVSESKGNPFNSWLIKKNCLKPAFPKSKYKFTKSTESPKTYLSNGAIRIVNIKKFLKNKSFHTMKLTPFVMKEKSSIDIDTKFDYEITKLLLK